MVHLHDRTRRRIALAIFFALGLIPTLAVSAWGLWWRSAWHVEREAEQLGWRLGMTVSLAGIRHPEPGVVVYEGLQVCEPEGHRAVFACGEARVCWNDVLESREPGLRVILSRPEVNASQWREVWRVVERVLARRTHEDDVPLQLSADELRVVDRELSEKLVQVEARVEASPGGPQIQASFRLPGEPTSEPARILVARNRQVTPPVTEFAVDTNGSPMPCRLLAIGVSGFDLLGPTCWFRGTLQASLADDGPAGELSGEFADVDLDRLVSDHLSHQLSGAARLTVQTARFRHGRLEEAEGSLVGGPGKVGRSLLELAIQRLGMAGGIGIVRDDRLVPYEQLAVWFACDAKGLRVRGLSPPDASGTMLAGRTGAILREPQSSDLPLPLATVVQALAPETERLVPIARQNDWLLRRLPSARPNAENPLRHVPP